MVCITGLQVNMNLLYLHKNFMNFSHHICSRVMWKYLEHIAVMLSNVVKVLRVMPQSEAQLLRRGLTQRCTSSVGQRRIGTPRTTSEAVPFVTGDDGKLLPGVFVLGHISIFGSLSLSFTLINLLCSRLYY